MSERNIISDPFLIAFVLAVCAFVFYQGRVAAALGGFCACANWMGNVDIGPVHIFRVFAATLLCTAGVAALRNRKAVGQCFAFPVVAPCIWLLFGWTLWIAVKVVMASSERDNDIFVSFLLYSLAPIILMLLFINEIVDVREMAYGFVLCSTAASVASLYVFSTSPVEAARLIRGFGEVNYLTFSYELAIAVLFGAGLLVASKRMASKAAFLAMAGICGIVMLMTSARQSALGLGVALAYVSWVTARRGRKVLVILALSVVCAGLVAATYLSTDIGERFLIPKWSKVDVSADIRQQYWIEGWNAFLQHPGTGGGLTYLPGEDTAHNLIIDLLASQGMVGFLFLAGFAALTFMAVRNEPFRAMRTEMRTWKAILLSIILFTIIHSFASGSVMGLPEFIWAPFLLIQLAAIAEREARSRRDAPLFSAQLPRTVLRTRLSQRS